MIKKNIILLVSLLILLFPKNIFAQEICDTNQTNKMYNLTNAIKVKYDYDKNTELFKVTLYNVSNEIGVIGNDGSLSIPNSNGEVIFENYIGGITYKFTFVPINQDCEYELDFNKSFYVPKYNKFSENEECNTYKDFKLCNKWYQGNIDDTTFYSELEKYKNANIETVEDTNTKDFDIKKIIYISIPIVLLILLIVIVIVVKKKKKKVL